MAKIVRLRKAQDIERVYKRGKSVSDKFLRIKYLPNNLAKSRVTIVISQKVVKLAVDRNVIKRRLRPLLEKNVASLPKSFDVIVTAKPGTKQLNAAKLKISLLELLKDIK